MPDFSRVIDIHSKLAKRLKQFDSATKNIPQEVLNEYRYACRALIEAISLQSKPESDDFKHAEAKAYHALLNAYHDLVDGLNISLIDTLDKLNEQCLPETIKVLGSKRMDIVKLTIEVDEKIAESREKPKLRLDIYDNGIYDKYFDQLLEFYRDIQISTQDIFTICDNSKREKILLYILAVFGIILGIIGIVIGVFI